MRCRQCIKNSNGSYDIVWFGKTSDLSAKTNNYVDKVAAVESSLVQRLSILRGELWYQINYGLPLVDKIKNKAIIDSSIINIIQSHPDVAYIASYDSSTEKNNYKFNCKIYTIYNEELNLSL